MESEASELPKGLVLGRDENIHIRLTRSTPLDDVGSYKVYLFSQCKFYLLFYLFIMYT